MGKLAIKVQTIVLGEDTQRFLAVLPAIKKIDDYLDKISPDTWQTSAATLGDEPSPFLQYIFKQRPDIRADIEKLADTYGVVHADMWQNCNLLAMQLTKIRDLSKEVRKQENLSPPDFSAREQLVQEHEMLSVLATNFAVANFKETANALRNVDKNNLKAAREAAIDDREVLVSKHPRLTSKLVDFAKMQQAVDDANDFIVDLRSEVELGRITPNRHVLEMKKQGMNLKSELDKLKKQNPKTFDKGELLPASSLGAFADDIRADLRKHLPEIKKHALFTALCGIAYRANVFPTTGVDHDLMTTKVKLQGDMGWALRLTEAAHAKTNVRDLGK